MNYIILNNTEDFRSKIKINGFKEVECRVWDFEDKTEGNKNDCERYL